MDLRRRFLIRGATGMAALIAVMVLALSLGTPGAEGAPTKILWVSPRAFVVGQNIAGGTLTLSSPSGDEQHVTTDKAGDLQWVDLPLQLQNSMKIKRVITCYKVDAPTSYISQVRLATSTVPPTATVIYDDPTDLTSTAGACRYGMSVSPISITGEITLALRLNFADPKEAIDLGAIGIVYQ